MKSRNLFRLFQQSSLNFFGNKKFSIKSGKPLKVLGIETSCDDTGVAILNSTGEILSQSLMSQQNIHLKYGGIIPPRAEDLHRENIEKCMNECIEKINFDINNLDAIAVTNRPGLPLSLKVGLRYAKHLSRKYSKPIVPIHHMEAHALSVRLENEVDYPFLCLLISGGHSQLVVVTGPTNFYLLGEALDDAPGEAFDKVARRLRLRNLPKFEWMNGGAAIELAAKEAENSDRFEFALPLARKKDCQFSFAGLKNSAFRSIKDIELENDIKPDEVIPYYQDFCAGFLKACTRHLSNRTQRAIEYCERKNLLKNSKNLVVSGGVASNDFIFNSVSTMASTYQYKTFRPSKELCRDNGVMIAWNGIELINANPDILLNQNLEEIEVIGKCPLGESLVEDVTNENISCKWVKVVM